MNGICCAKSSKKNNCPGEICNGSNRACVNGENWSKWSISKFDFTLNINDCNNVSKCSKLQQLLLVARRQWSSEWSAVRSRIFTDGITNKLIGYYKDTSVEDVILVRIYGESTELFIDREKEIANMSLMSAKGQCPPIYARFRNGICYGYTPGSTLNQQQMISCPRIAGKIAEKLAQMHSITSEQPMKPCLFQLMDKYIKLIPDQYTDANKQAKYEKTIARKQVLVNEVNELKDHLESLGSPVVFCHNDLLMKNIIYNAESDVLTFVDFEYADYNYLAFDIGNHFCEYAGVDTFDSSLYPSAERQLMWLNKYLQCAKQQKQEKQANSEHHGEHVVTSDHDKDHVHKLYVEVNKFALAAHLIWTMWALIQAQHSTIDFDFIHYASERLKEYFARKDQFLSM